MLSAAVLGIKVQHNAAHQLLVNTATNGTPNVCRGQHHQPLRPQQALVPDTLVNDVLICPVLIFLFDISCVGSACRVVYSQCGGIGWTGPTTCCLGSICTFNNQYYSQCLPVTTSSGGTATSTSRVTTSPTPIISNTHTTTGASTPSTTVTSRATSTNPTTSRLTVSSSSSSSSRVTTTIASITSSTSRATRK